MEAAVVDLTTNIVINKIVADAAIDPAPDGTRLVDVPEGVMCEISWLWDGINFVPPVEGGI
jgi:hypothetical protein